MKPIDDAVVTAIRGYAESPIGLVAVLSEEVGGMVYVAKFIRANTLRPVPDDSPFDSWKDWEPAKLLPEKE